METCGNSGGHSKQSKQKCLRVYIYDVSLGSRIKVWRLRLRISGLGVRIEGLRFRSWVKLTVLPKYDEFMLGSKWNAQ